MHPSGSLLISAIAVLRHVSEGSDNTLPFEVLQKYIMNPHGREGQDERYEDILHEPIPVVILRDRDPTLYLQFCTGSTGYRPTGQRKGRRDRG